MGVVLHRMKKKTYPGLLHVALLLIFFFAVKPDILVLLRIMKYIFANLFCVMKK